MFCHSSFVYFCLGWCGHLYFDNYKILWSGNCNWTCSIFKSEQYCFSCFWVLKKIFLNFFADLVRFFFLLLGYVLLVHLFWVVIFSQNNKKIFLLSLIFHFKFFFSGGDFRKVVEFIFFSFDHIN
jgi:hypothetical protein